MLLKHIFFLQGIPCLQASYSPIVAGKTLPIVLRINRFYPCLPAVLVQVHIWSVDIGWRPFALGYVRIKLGYTRNMFFFEGQAWWTTGFVDTHGKPTVPHVTTSWSCRLIHPTAWFKTGDHFLHSVFRLVRFSDTRFAWCFFLAGDCWDCWVMERRFGNRYR